MTKGIFQVVLLRGTVAAVAASLGACVTTAPDRQPETELATGVPPTQPFCSIASGSVGACAQPIQLPPGFSVAAYQDPGVLKGALGKPGEGKLCCAVVAEATQAVNVFRGWAPHYVDKDNPVKTPLPPDYFPTFQFGGWWSPTEPPGSRDQYHHDDDVCAAWNSLTVYTKCQIEVGAQVVIGRGQSATCGPNQYLPDSDVLQINFPNGSKDNTGQCTTFVWPGTP